MYIFKFGNWSLCWFLFLFFSSFSQLHNKGPSSISRTVLEVGWPSQYREEHLLYALQIITDGPVRCSVNGSLNPLELEVKLLLSLYPSLFFFPLPEGVLSKESHFQKKESTSKHFYTVSVKSAPWQDLSSYTEPVTWMNVSFSICITNLSLACVTINLRFLCFY